MQSDRARTGPGHFQWNRGGWFGSQIGGTAWLLVGAAAMVPRAPVIAAVWLACFAAVNTIGLGMWGRRDRLNPYPAIQMLLLACGIGGLLAWATLDLFGPEDVAPIDPPRQGYLAMLIVPALMAWFALMERGARGRGSLPGGHA